MSGLSNRYSLDGQASGRRGRLNIRVWFALLIVGTIPVGALGEACKQLSFSSTINSNGADSHPLAPNLRFRLTSMKDEWGWVISISPNDSENDWTAPVTFPIRNNEQQTMGSGYGSTVQDKMTHPNVVQFVRTPSEFTRYSRLANEALSSPQTDAARNFIKEDARLRKSRATVEALKYESGVAA